ncbi:MAG: PrgI family protein [Microgenomates bacterium OLB22]|nr:MAG: PrgI family protein [Microgenomates bacterium OLB22]
MEEHAVPKQITTFEFKLIGFLTVRQFLYILIFSAFGYLIYVLAPFRLIGVIGGLVSAGVGTAFALIRFNERPLDHAVRMLFVRLTSPSQYFFSADNKPSQVRNVSYPTMTTSQLETPATTIEPQSIPITPSVPVVHVLQQPSLPPVQDLPPQPMSIPPTQTDIATPINPTALSTPVVSSTDQSALSEKKLFITGVVMNTKELPLPNMLIYIKDQSGKILRLLKTSEKGQFSSVQPLPDGVYTMETQDPQQRFFL